MNRASLSDVILNKDFKSYQVVSIVHSILSQLEVYHNANLIHGSINPNTIYFDVNQNEALLSAVNFNKDVIKKDIRYLAPEQIRCELGPISFRVDFYLLGLTLYELLVKKAVVLNAYDQQMRYMQTVVDPPCPHEIDPHIPKALSLLTMRCLKKCPNDRPNSVREIKESLVDILNEETFSPPELMNELRYEKMSLSEAMKSPSIIWVHGPMGCGKSNLINQCLAQREDAKCIKLSISNSIVNTDSHCLDSICSELIGSSNYQINWFDEKDPHGTKSQQINKIKELIQSEVGSKDMIIWVENVQWLPEYQLQDLFSVFNGLDSFKLIFSSHLKPYSSMSKDISKEIMINPISKKIIMDYLQSTLMIKSNILPKVVDKLWDIGKQDLFEINQVIQFAYKENILFFLIDSMSWAWNDEPILEWLFQQKDHSIFSKKVLEFNPKLKLIAQKIAVFGKRVRIKYLEKYLNDCEWKSLLDALISKGYIQKVGDEVEFAHTRMFEAMCGSLSDQEKTTYHLAVIQAILSSKKGLDNKDTILLAKHLLLVGPDRSNTLSQAKVKGIFYEAANYAKENGEFQLAIQFYEELLLMSPSDLDRINLSICYELTGEITSAESTLAPLILIKEKSDVFWHYLRLLVCQGRHDQVIEFGLRIIKLWGIDMVEQPTLPQSLFILFKTKKIIKSFESLEIEQLDIKKDQDSEQLIAILSQLVAPAFMRNKQLMLHIIYQMLVITERKGNTNSSGFALCCWGLILIMKKDYSGASFWGDMGLKLTVKKSSSGALGRCRFLMGHFIKPWTYPLSQCLVELEDAIVKSNGVKQGVFTVFSYLSFVSMSFFAAQNIQSIRKSMSKYSRIVSKYSITNFSKFEQITLRLFAKLETVGSHQQVFELEDIETQQVIVQIWYLLARLIFYTLFKDISNALIMKDKLKGIINEAAGTQFYPQYLFWSSIATLLAIQLDNKPLDVRIVIVKRQLKELKRMSESSPENYLAMVKLIEALLVRGGSQRLLLEAIKAAKTYDQVYIEALAYEQFIQKDNSVVYKAIDAYQRWGVFSKSVLMMNTYGVGANIEEVSIDMSALYKTSEAIASYSDQSIILQLVLDNIKSIAGATDGDIYLFEGNDYSSKIEGIPSKYKAWITDFLKTTKPNKMSGETLAGVIEEILTICDASDLIVPLQVYGSFKGIIFLTNHETPLIRSLKKINQLMVMATQSAILIENIEVIKTLDDKVKARTLDLEQSIQRNLELEKKSVEVQLTTGFAHEIRNALSGASIAIKSSLKNDMGNQDDIRKVLALSSRSMDRALSITDQISEYAKLGHKDFSDGPSTNISEEIKQLIQQIKNDPRFFDVSFEQQIEDSLYVKIQVDELYSIIENLLINAQEAFQSSNRVESLVIKVQAKKLKNSICILIIDNGPGIKKNTIGDIFKPFFTTNPISGTGLGLSIVKRLVESRNGMVKLTNIDSGCKATVELPECYIASQEVLVPA